MKKNNAEHHYTKSLKRSGVFDLSLVIMTVIIIVNLCFILFFVRVIGTHSKSQTNGTANAAYSYTLSDNAKRILKSVTADGLDSKFDASTKKWCEKMDVSVFATYNNSVVYNSTGLKPDEFYLKYKEMLGYSPTYQYTTGLRITQDGTLVTVQDKVAGNERRVFLVDSSFSFDSVDTEAIDKFFLYASLIVAVDVFCLVALLINRHRYTKRVERFVTEPIIKLKGHLDEMIDGYFDHEAIYGYDNEIGDIYRAVDHIRIQLRNYKAERKSSTDSKKVLVSGLMHDIATPITRISGCAAIIRDGIAQNDDEIKQYAELIVRNTEDIDVLLKKLGELAKYDENIIQTHMIPVRIEPLIRHYIEQISVELAGMDADCTFVCEYEEPPVCNLDVRSAKRVMMNIIYNSVKYKKTNEHCHITITLKKAANGDCVISFADNGIGIEKGSEDKIFDMFYREDSARSHTSEGKGLGLGLFVSREIVLCNNGHIWAKNNKEGLTVFISLPVTNEPPVEWE